MNKKQEQPIIVAQIVGKWLGGGVEAMLMNYYRHIDRTKIQFDFICDADSTDIPYDEIKKLGGRVILCPPYQKLPQYLKFLTKLFKENKYKIVHSHINTLSVFPLYSAKKAGVRTRIAHSHSTSNKKEWKKTLFKNLLRPFSKRYATDYFACSEHAGRWLFGNKTFDNKEVTIIPNAIDIEKFKFDKTVRTRLRKELNINKSTFVVSHIGRFVPQKNHTFLIDVFNEVHKQRPDSVLLLIGQGPLEEKIKQKVKKLGLEKSVKFLGQRNDTNKLYSVMDVFVLPSLYEGLGMVAIEAQINGLRLICSNNTPSDVKMHDQVFFAPLKCNKWVDLIQQTQENPDRIMKKNHTPISDNLLYRHNINIQPSILLSEYLNLSIVHKIELFGIPGCGKTTFAKEKLDNYINLNKIYIYHDNRIIRNIKKIKIFFMVTIFNPKHLKKINTVIKSVKFHNLKNKIKMFLFLSTSIYLVEKAKQTNRALVLEEGMFVTLWAICYNSEYHKQFITNFFNTFNDLFLDEVIYFDIPEKTILERLKSRAKIKGGSELQHDIRNNAESLKRAILINKEILDQINLLPNFKLINYLKAKI